MGVKVEEAAEDIEDVKPEVEDVTVEGEGAGGGGVGCDPLVAGGGRPCLGPHPSEPVPGADPPLCARGAGQRVLPDAPPFLSPEVTYVTLRWAFRRMLRHRIHNKGEGGAWRYRGGGAWAWKPLAGKPLSPVPEPIGAGDLMQAKDFSAPWGRLMRSSHWELLFLHWEERGWVKL